MIPGNGVGGDGRRAARDRLHRRLGRLRRARRGGRVRAVSTCPDGMALDDAVALLADGRTATMLAAAAAIAAGRARAVLAAAGGVGTLLVQLARRRARSSSAPWAARPSCGVVALARRRGRALRGRSPGPFDVVFDGVGGDARPRRRSPSSRAGGRMLSYGLASGTWAGDRRRGGRGARRHARPARPLPGGAARATPSARWPAALKPVIGQRFPLERAADAHAAIEARATIGKTLLESRRLMSVRPVDAGP